MGKTVIRKEVCPVHGTVVKTLRWKLLTRCPACLAEATAATARIWLQGRARVW